MRHPGRGGEPTPGALDRGDLGAVREAETLGRLPEPGPQLYEHCLPDSLLRRWLTEMRVLRPGTAYHSLDRPPSAATRRHHRCDRTPHRARPTGGGDGRAPLPGVPFDGLSDELRRAFLTADHLTRVRIARDSA